MIKLFNFKNLSYSTLEDLIKNKIIEVGRGDVISKIDINNNPGANPIYSSSSKNGGKMGEYSKYMFNEELITWSIDGGGKFFYKKKHKFSVTNVCGYIKRKDQSIDLKYLHEVLDYQHRHLNFDYQFKAHPSVIEKLYVVPLLPLKKQLKIASVLISLDEIINKYDQELSKLKDLKKSLLEKLMTEGIGNKIFKKIDLKYFKERKLKETPKDWKVDKFKKFITLKRGHDLPLQNRIKGKVPIYGSNGIVGYHNKSTSDEAGVITGRSGTIGDVHYSKKSHWSLNTTLYVSNFHKNLPKFVYYYLYYFNLKNFSSGTGVPTLNRNDVHSVMISFPTKKIEQEKISDILFNLDNLLMEKKIIFVKTQFLKNSLQQDLLSERLNFSKLN